MVLIYIFFMASDRIFNVFIHLYFYLEMYSDFYVHFLLGLGFFCCFMSFCYYLDIIWANPLSDKQLINIFFYFARCFFTLLVVCFCLNISKFNIIPFNLALLLVLLEPSKKHHLHQMSWSSSSYVFFQQFHSAMSYI